MSSFLSSKEKASNADTFPRLLEQWPKIAVFSLEPLFIFESQGSIAVILPAEGGTAEDQVC
jgi:hypothetical protein